MTRNVGIVDLDPSTRNDIVAMAMMELHHDVERIDSVAAYEAVYADGRGPDILLLGLNSSPEAVLDIARHVRDQQPRCGLVAYATTPAPELVMSAMTAEVRRFLTFPFAPETLSAAIEAVTPGENDANEEQLSLPPAPEQPAVQGKVVALFSPKGGVGTTTLVANLGCALRGYRVLLIDANISYGNLGLFLDTDTTRSMIELVGDAADITPDALDAVLLTHGPTGIKMLLAPPEPVSSEKVTKEHLEAIIVAARTKFDFVLIDTWPSYEERVRTVLEAADRIIMPLSPDTPTLKNVGSFLRVASLLGFRREKIVPVLIRANTVKQEYIDDMENWLKRPLDSRVVSDGIRVTESINNGRPFVLTAPHEQVSQDVIRLAHLLDGTASTTPSPVAQEPVTGLVKRIFTRRVA